jgi:hypothetical protein
MRIQGLVLAAVLAICVSPIAQADHIKQRGGTVLNAKIGPWYIIRQTYEDGSRVCWALNPNYGNRDPSFAYIAARGGDHPVSIMRFDATRRARANETVTLMVGNERVTLIHGSEDVGNAFHPMTNLDARKITGLLEARQTQSPKTFFVVDGHGGKFKYDARSTTKMISYLEKNCGYQRQ